MKKKAKYKYHIDKKNIGGLMASGIGLGIMSQTAGEMGSPQTQQAIGNVSRAYPKVGGMIGTGMVLDALGTMKKKLRRRTGL